jgi:hypothetical protein
MSVLSSVQGQPGTRAFLTVTSRMVTRGGYMPVILPVGRYIAGDASRDPGNSPQTGRLRAGTLMGKIASVVNSLGTVGWYAPSVIDVTAGALTGTGTSITLSAAGAAELNRRCGASGTFTLTGPPAANGVARSITVTYSAINLTTGVVTVTAVGVNEVQTLNFANSPAGTFTLTIVDLNGLPTTTPPITYSGTAATLVSNINTAITTAIGASLVVASGSAVTAIALTFSGTGYAGLPQTLVQVGTNELTGGTVAVSRTTAGVNGAFVAGSLVGSTDGSQTPITFIPNGAPLQVTDFDGTNLVNQEFPALPVECLVDEAQLLPWPADTGIQNFIKNNLSTQQGGKFVFAGSSVF